MLNTVLLLKLFKKDVHQIIEITSKGKTRWKEKASVKEGTSVDDSRADKGNEGGCKVA